MKHKIIVPHIYDKVLCSRDLIMYSTQIVAFTSGCEYSVVGRVDAKSDKHKLLVLVNNLGMIHYLHLSFYKKYFRDTSDELSINTNIEIC